MQLVVARSVLTKMVTDCIPNLRLFNKASSLSKHLQSFSFCLTGRFVPNTFDFSARVFMAVSLSLAIVDAKAMLIAECSSTFHGLFKLYGDLQPALVLGLGREHLLLWK